MVNSEEVWRDIPVYEGLYQVSDQGRVKSLSKNVEDPSGRVRCYGERILKVQRVNKYGHKKVSLYKNKTSREFLVHRLVLISFVSEPGEGQEALHEDGDPTNNSLVNLRWGTSKENSEDCARHNRVAKGAWLPQTILTETDVLKIREDERTSTVIAKDFGVSPRHIRAIKSKTYWNHI